MDTSKAFHRAVCNSQLPWPVQVDNEVLQWLRRVIGWCVAHQVDTASGPGVGWQGETSEPSPQVKRKWNKATATMALLQLIEKDANLLNQTQRYWADQLKCSPGLIASLKLWKAVQEVKNSNPDDVSVRALATDPRFIAEMLSDKTLQELTYQLIPSNRRRYLIKK